MENGGRRLLFSALNNNIWTLMKEEKKTEFPSVETKEKKFHSLPFITDQKSLANVERNPFSVGILVVQSVWHIYTKSIDN